MRPGVVVVCKDDGRSPRLRWGQAPLRGSLSALTIKADSGVAHASSYRPWRYCRTVSAG